MRVGSGQLKMLRQNKVLYILLSLCKDQLNIHGNSPLFRIYPMQKPAAVLFVVFIVVAVTTVSQPAYAYLDPGTGSMVLQAVVAGFFGALFAIKMYWAKITGFFSRKKDGPQ
jgi:nitrate/nitrite transporter NarK